MPQSSALLTCYPAPHSGEKMSFADSAGSARGRARAFDQDPRTEVVFATFNSSVGENRSEERATPAAISTPEPSAAVIGMALPLRDEFVLEEASISVVEPLPAAGDDSTDSESSTHRVRLPHTSDDSGKENIVSAAYCRRKSVEHGERKNEARHKKSPSWAAGGASVRDDIGSAKNGETNAGDLTVPEGAVIQSAIPVTSDSPKVKKSGDADEYMKLSG